MSSEQEDTRNKIIYKYLENPHQKYSKIAKEVDISLSTVKRVITKHKQGLSTRRKPGSGRASGPSDMNLAREVRRKFAQKPSTSVRDMAEQAGTSKSQVQRIKKFYNLRSYKVQKVPDRSEEKEKIAKKRARKLYTQYLTKFDCVILDDETYCKADFSQLPGHEYYTAKRKGGANKKFTTRKTSKFPKQYMVWQAICSCGLRSKEIVVQGTINSKIYIEKCLQSGLLPFIAQHQGSVAFWPDLATSHYSKATMEWYEANNVTVVPKDANPPNCPELRPIERYWALMKQSLKKTQKTAKNSTDFENRWRRAYTEVKEDTVKNLMAHLNRKVYKFFSKK